MYFLDIHIKNSIDSTIEKNGSSSPQSISHARYHKVIPGDILEIF
jgi:hypothetical protein